MALKDRLLSLPTLLLLCALAPARADVLYDVVSQGVGFTEHQQFVVPAILDSYTYIDKTQFTLNEAIGPIGGPLVPFLVIDPVADGQKCLNIFLSNSVGPCLEVSWNISKSPVYVGFPELTSFGTFTSSDHQATITISPIATAVPEPSSLPLLGVVAAIVLGLMRRGYC